MNIHADMPFGIFKQPPHEDLAQPISEGDQSILNVVQKYYMLLKQPNIETIETFVLKIFPKE